MKPSSRAGMLRHIRTLFHDLQEWGWIPVKFSPERVLRTPRSLSAQIGPAPRIVNDGIWCKLIHAGLNLQETDLTHSAGYPYFYPPEMIRALSALWLFGGLRRDEILRMRCGCIRWQTSEEDAGRRICLLDVPVSKTYVAFTKPVDPIVGEYIEQWENVLNTQPLQEDPKTGESVHFLFMHRGKRINGRYIMTPSFHCFAKKQAYLSRMPEAESPVTVPGRQSPASFITPGSRLIFLNCRNGWGMPRRNRPVIMLILRQQGLPAHLKKRVTLNVTAAWFQCSSIRTPSWKACLRKENPGNIMILGMDYAHTIFLTSVRTGWPVPNVHFTYQKRHLRHSIWKAVRTYLN